MMPTVPPASHYPIVIQWSDEDQTFIVTVPDLPGCMADGPTHEAAAREAQIAIQLWLDISLESGHKIPRPTPHLLARTD